MQKNVEPYKVRQITVYLEKSVDKEKLKHLGKLNYQTMSAFLKTITKIFIESKDKKEIVKKIKKINI